MSNPAPICHVSQDEIIVQPPIKQLPSVPDATDLKSALAAIQALRQIVYALTGQQASSGGTTRAGSTQAPSKQQQKVGRWVEINRATKEVTIPINDTGEPPSVTVTRTNSITMRDTVTGEILVIKG